MVNLRRWAAIGMAALLAGPAAGQSADPGLELLQQARAASAKRDFKTAAQRYQDFLQKFASHTQASAARYGLALASLEAPDRDYAKIAPLLDAVADDGAFADRAAAQSWCGAAYREWARRVPAEAPARLERAAKRFGEAVQSYLAQTREWADRGDNELPAGLEGAVRCRADQAEALLAAGRPKEAMAAVETMARERWLARSKWRECASYVIGCAAYASDDPVTAGRALVRLAPFEQPFIGPHARYLLGRIHHLAGEATEALEHYEAVPAALVRQVLAARKAVQSNAPEVRDHPLERARLESLANGPAPDFAGDALFQAGSLLYEQKRFADALDRFTKTVQQHPKHPRIDEAKLLAGICRVQGSQFAEATRALQPLLDHPRLGPRARIWTARALVRWADPAKPDSYKRALDQAAEYYTQAAGDDAGLLFEHADVLRRAGRIADAAPVYQKLAGGPRGEEAQARLVACLQISGKPKEAEEAFRRFEKEHPKSLFMAEALFHYAECAFGAAQAAAGDAAQPQYAEAIKRYEALVARYPDLPQASLCRYRLAMARHALGQFAEAAAALGAIAEPDRGGPLAASSYVLADSLLRAGPPADQARDAVAAARRIQQLNLALQALQAFLGGQAQSPQAPEAMMKVGYCYQELARFEAVPQERVKAAQAAVQTYEQVRAQFPEHPLRAVAEYERANSFALAGDVPTALSKFPRFHAAPLGNAPIAPMALLREAQLLRQLGRAPEALNVLVECRTKHEETIKKDPSRASWVPLIRYHHGLVLKDVKQPAEAAKVLQSVIQEYPSTELAKASRELLEEIKP
jgi:TolA-binding protein